MTFIPNKLTATQRERLPKPDQMAAAVIAVAGLNLDTHSPEPLRAAAYRILGEYRATRLDGSDWWQEVMDLIP